MRHQWYADHRDVVKWGALVSLAREANAHTIVQVAYARDDEVNAVLEVDGRGTVPVPAEVWDHFRNFERIRPLGETLELEISILGAAFHQGRRTQYRDACIAELEKLPRRPAVVLLDPDTGLAPTATAKAKHVTPEDVRAFWNALRPREWLVVYQHAHQRKAHEQTWAETRRLLVDSGSLPEPILCYRSPLARDVALFAARRA